MTRAVCAAALLAVAMPAYAQRGPATAQTHLPAGVLALACAPTVTHDEHPDSPLRVWAVDDTMSLATIEHACDAVEVGDFLEPFSLPTPPVAAADKPKAERDHYARVMKGVDLRQTFGKGDFFIIARGSNDGVTPGSQFVIYRDKQERDNFLFELGEAVAVDVKPDTSTLQITKSLDAAIEGDLVAQRR